jgi:hypothetical protein
MIWCFRFLVTAFYFHRVLGLNMRGINHAIFSSILQRVSIIVNTTCLRKTLSSIVKGRNKLSSYCECVLFKKSVQVCPLWVAWQFMYFIGAIGISVNWTAHDHQIIVTLFTNATLWLVHWNISTLANIACFICWSNLYNMVNNLHVLPRRSSAA